METKARVIFVFVYLIYEGLVGCSAQTICDELSTTTTQVTIDETNDVNNTQTISGPFGTFLAILIAPDSCPLPENVTLVVTDVETDTLLAEIAGSDLQPPLYICSFTSNVSFYVESADEQQFQLSIPYIVINDSSIIVNATVDDADGWIDSQGDDECTVINYRQTWLVSSGNDNVVHFYLEQLTLDDAMGDYLAFGPGNKTFASAPSMLVSGNRTNLRGVDVYGNVSYVHLFSKYYSSLFSFSLFYNSTLYVPPTENPPTTIPPPATLNATFTFDENENITTLVHDFEDTIDIYAKDTCEGPKKNCNVTLTTYVTEAVQTRTCLVVVYYVDITSGSCQGNKSFTIDSYKMMMGNFSNEINTNFRTLGDSCPADNWWWVITVICIMVIGILMVVATCIFKNRNMYQKIPDIIPREEIKRKTSSGATNSTSEGTGNEIQPFENAKISTPILEIQYFPSTSGYDNRAFTNTESAVRIPGREENATFGMTHPAVMLATGQAMRSPSAGSTSKSQRTDSQNSHLYETLNNANQQQ